MSQGKGKGENHTTGSDSRPSESSSPYSHGQVEPQRFLAAAASLARCSADSAPDFFGLSAGALAGAAFPGVGAVPLT